MPFKPQVMVLAKIILKLSSKWGRNFSPQRTIDVILPAYYKINSKSIQMSPAARKSDFVIKNNTGTENKFLRTFCSAPFNGYSTASIKQLLPMLHALFSQDSG